VPTRHASRRRRNDPQRVGEQPKVIWDPTQTALQERASLIETSNSSLKIGTCTVDSFPLQEKILGLAANNPMICKGPKKTACRIVKLPQARKFNAHNTTMLRQK
jgi:hypothetical protein